MLRRKRYQADGRISQYIDSLPCLVVPYKLDGQVTTMCAIKGNTNGGVGAATSLFVVVCADMLWLVWQSLFYGCVEFLSRLVRLAGGGLVEVRV